MKGVSPSPVRYVFSRVLGWFILLKVGGGTIFPRPKLKVGARLIEGGVGI
jgi:hypothetical protein